MSLHPGEDKTISAWVQHLHWKTFKRGHYQERKHYYMLIIFKLVIFMKFCSKNHENWNKTFFKLFCREVGYNIVSRCIIHCAMCWTIGQVDLLCVNPQRTLHFRFNSFVSWKAIQCKSHCFNSSPSKFIFCMIWKNRKLENIIKSSTKPTLGKLWAKVEQIAVVWWIVP